MPKGRLNLDWKPPKPPYASICATLLKVAKLNDKERQFLDEIQGFLKLTPAQSRWLSRIADRAARGEAPRRSRRRDDEAIY